MPPRYSAIDRTPCTATESPQGDVPIPRIANRADHALVYCCIGQTIVLPDLGSSDAVSEEVRDMLAARLWQVQVYEPIGNKHARQPSSSAASYPIAIYSVSCRGGVQTCPYVG
jgi:hypothetical protein